MFDRADSASAAFRTECAGARRPADHADKESAAMSFSYYAG